MNPYTKTDSLAGVPSYVKIGRLIGVNIISGGSGYGNVDADMSTIIPNAPAPAAFNQVIIEQSQSLGNSKSTVILFSSDSNGTILQAKVITDNQGSWSTANPFVPKFLATPSGTDVTPTTAAVLKFVYEPIEVNPAEVVLVDLQEARVPDNRVVGIKTPGWQHVKTWTTHDGIVRHRVNVYEAMNPNGISGDNDNIPNTPSGYYGY